MWVIPILDQKTRTTYQRRTRILVSVVGALSVPKSCEVPGADTFKGPLFHSAKWDHTFDYAGKEVVVLGTLISSSTSPTTKPSPRAMAAAPHSLFSSLAPSPRRQKIIQFSRQSHWLAERPDPIYSPLERWIFRHVPLAMRIYRAKAYYDTESDFAGFNTKTGGAIRKGLEKE